MKHDYIRSFRQGIEFLGDKVSKQIAPNLRIARRDDAVAITLYATDILVYFVDGTFTAHDGGYATTTTTKRLNQFGPHGWKFWHDNADLYGQNNNETPLLMFKSNRQPV